MKFRAEQSGIARAEAGQRLVALGQALAGAGEAASPLAEELPSAVVPPDVPLTYEIEVSVDQAGGGKLEVAVSWAAAPAEP